MDDLTENLNTLSKMFESDPERRVFKKHIEYIRFPFFKNYTENLKVNFNFPITFLVGQNGSGKSSLLQALFGAPKGKSIESYWYTTALDPITDLRENRHSFVYSFITQHSREQVEVLKERILRKGNPDYWEPARPKIKYGMPKFPKNANKLDSSSTRWNLLEKEVLYMDFRYSLSAYDKFFYFGDKLNTSALKSKQDIIRKHSFRLKNAFESSTKTTYYSRSSEIPISLSDKEIIEIQYILGKKYIEAKILQHDFYDRKKGFAIRYKTNSLTYSEAYAGSGETAVVKIVHDICNAKNNCLVLLDEPETSLHPAAQKRLINFILKQTKHKKLQVVISTHSPDIIDGMPPASIKILYENMDTGKVGITENVFPENAFVHIGRSFLDKKTIIVEDDFAKLIIDKVLELSGETGLFDVKFFPGGESRIKQECMLVYSREEDKNHFVIFDGDQSTDHIDVSSLSESEKTQKNLKNIIKDMVGEEIKFNHDSGQHNQKIGLMLKYIKYHYSHVFFLPEKIPEEIIWCDDVLSKADISADEIQTIQDTSEHKKKFNLFAKYNLGDDTALHQKQAFEYFLVRWLRKKDKNYIKILDIIAKIKRVSST